MNTLHRLFLPPILLSLGLVACAATTDDSVQGTEEALTSMKKTRLPNSPGWQVTCTASDGVSWTRQATDAEASGTHYCDAMSVPGEQHGGFSAITDIPTSHAVAFDVEEKGNYLLKLPAYTEWIGDTSIPRRPTLHASASSSTIGAATRSM